jgi:hypothetical protein
MRELDEVSTQPADAFEDGEAGERMRQLKKELRDLDLDYEREREELASGPVSASGTECVPAVGAKRYDGAVALLASEPLTKEVVQERISSVQQAIAGLREERSRLGIGVDSADRKSLGISVRADGEGGVQATEQTSEQTSVDSEERHHVEAHSSYLRYTVKSNLASITRHHKEVAERLESVGAGRGGAAPRPSTSALLLGLDSFSEVTAAGRSHNNKFAVTTLLEGGHPEVAQELRRQKQEKEKRDRSMIARPISFPPSHTPGEREIAQGSNGAVDARASAAAAAAAAVLESRRGRKAGKLQDPSTILEGLSRYTPRGGGSGASKVAASERDDAARWAYRWVIGSRAASMYRFLCPIPQAPKPVLWVSIRQLYIYCMPLPILDRNSSSGRPEHASATETAAEASMSAPG